MADQLGFRKTGSGQSLGVIVPTGTPAPTTTPDPNATPAPTTTTDKPKTAGR
jgi:hypothetical protein